MNIETGLISKIDTQEDYLHVLDERINKDFFEEHGDVFLAISTHYSKYSTVPEHETLQKLFPNFQFYSGNEPLQYFIDKLKEQYKKKLFNTVLPKVAELLPTDINEAERLLQNLVLTSKAAIKVGVEVDVHSEAASIMSDYEVKEANLGIDGYTTSWPYLDNLTCGYHPGDLVIWMGKAKMCKSWLLCWQAAKAHKEHNVPCLFITKEISAPAIRRRIHAIECRLSYDAIRKGLLTPNQKQIYFNYLKEKEEEFKSGAIAPFEIKGFDLADGSSGVSSIIPKVERYLSDGGMLFVDGIYLIPDDRGGNEWRSVVNVATDLKILAQTYNIPVITTTQQNMGDKSDTPKLEDAAYGKYIVQYADLIMGIGRSDIDKKANRGALHVLGYREGDSGFFGVNMNFDPIDFSQSNDKFINEAYDDDEEVYKV